MPLADGYQAANAVKIPRYPPNTVSPAWDVKLPIASTKYVIVRRTNTVNTGRLRAVAATVIYAVKIAQASKNIPRAIGSAEAGIFPTLNVTRKANAIQNAPNDVKAVAPKVLFRLNSHIPAQNWANPP
jgi:hypothetical protein